MKMHNDDKFTLWFMSILLVGMPLALCGGFALVALATGGHP